MGQITRTNFGLVKRRVLSHAQILALPTTPVLLISGIPDSIILVADVALVFHWVANYTNIDVGAAVEIESAGGSSAASRLVEFENGGVTGLLAAGQDAFAFGGVPQLVFPQTTPASQVTMNYDFTANMRGENIVITASNGAAGDFEDGDALNTLAITVFYCVVPVVA